MAPRVSVATQKITRAGLNPSMTAPTADGDVIDYGNVILAINNTSGATLTVTVQTPGTVDGLPIGELTVSIPTAGIREIGPFPRSTFAQPSDAAVGANRVLVDYTGTLTGVTRCVKSL